MPNTNELPGYRALSPSKKKEAFCFRKESPDSFLTEIEHRLIVPPLQTTD